MASITRTKLLMAAGATALVFAVGVNQGHAATYVGLSQLTTDTSISTSSSGITLNNATFPDGSKTANCFIQIVPDANHGPSYKSYGSCAGDSITAVQTSYVNDNSAALIAGDTKGAALSIDSTGTWTFAYDAGPKYGANGSFTTTNLQVAVTNNSGERLVFLLNNDTQASRDGMFNYVDAGGEATPQCVQVSSTGSNGAFYEVATQAGSGTLAEASAASGASCGTHGNVPVEGVFFLPAQATGTATSGTTGATATATAVNSVGTASPTATTVTSVGTPAPTATTPVLAASYVRVYRTHGVTHLTWYSTDRVRGYNVFDGHTRINKHLVTSTTNRYHFNTRHHFHDLRLVAKG